MSFADKIASTTEQRRDPHYNFLVYGPAGVGKTYLIRTLDGPALIGSCESGLSSVLDTDIDYVELSSTDAMRHMYQYLAQEDHDYEWAVLDSISEMGEMCLSEEKAKTKDGRQAYGNMQDTIVGLLRAFRGLDMNVYFSAKQRRDSIDGSMLYIPSMPGSTLTEKRPISHDFDFVFPLQVEEKKGDEEVASRKLLTEGTPKFTAKARDPLHVLEQYEPPDLGRVRQKLIDAYSDD